MAFYRPTLSSLISRTKSDIQTRLPGAVASLRRSVELVFSKMVAGATHGLHGHLVWLSRQLFPDTAETEFIVRWANIWGLEKIAATKASGNALITGTNDTTCPALTEWELDDQVYIQQADATIVGGSATIEVEAEVAGADGNQDPSAILSLVSPVAGIDTDCTVDGSGLTGGNDEETDAELLVRLLLRLSSPPKGGGPGDYEFWALEVAGVTRAWQIPNADGAGTVALYFVRDNDSPIIPDSNEIAAVQAALDAAAPVTADPTAYAPTAVPLDFNMSVTPNTSAVKTAVENALEEFILDNGEADGVTLYLSQINEAISLAEGETDHVLNSPAADQVYTVGQIPTMGTVTFV